MARREEQSSDADDIFLLDLCQRAMDGDEKAERKLLETVAPVMDRVIARVVWGTSLDVEDILQDSLVALSKALPRFRKESPVIHYAARIASLTALSALRRWFRHEGKHVSTPVVEDRFLTPVPELPPMAGGAGQTSLVPGYNRGPETAAWASQQIAAVQTTLTRLPKHQSETIILHCIEGYTLEEVAGMTGAPIETIRSRLKLARRRLRSAFEAQGFLSPKRPSESHQQTTREGKFKGPGTWIET